MSAITYQAVAKICNQLQLVGDNPSVRKIRERIGGSHNIIAEHLRAWRHETALADSSNSIISEELQKAILAEFAQIASKSEAEFHANLQIQQSELEESMAAIVELEEKCAMLESLNEQQSHKSQQIILTLEKKLAALESSLELLKEREMQLQKNCELLTEKAHKAEIEAATAGAHATNFQNRTKELEQQLKNKQ